MSRFCWKDNLVYKKKIYLCDVLYKENAPQLNNQPNTMINVINDNTMLSCFIVNMIKYIDTSFDKKT